MLQCKCGSNAAYVDWWNNFRTRQDEVFVRCPACDDIGPVAKTENEAIALWEQPNGADHDI